MKNKANHKRPTKTETVKQKKSEFMVYYYKHSKFSIAGC